MDGTDARAMRALAHPLRLDLMELLAAGGPATAAACGRALGIPQANCSFHLRQLAKYGYVEEADQGEDRRERRWRLAESRSLIRFGPKTDRVVRRELERLVVERATQAILDHLDRADRADVAAADQDSPSEGIVAAVAAVTSQEADEIKRKWRELIAPYAATTTSAEASPEDSGRQPERGLVRIFMAMTPMAATGADEGDGGHGNRG